MQRSGSRTTAQRRRSGSGGRRIFFFSAAAFIAAALLALPSCSVPKEEKPLKSLTIAFQNFVGYGPFYLGRDKGFFRDEGVDLILVDEGIDVARRDAFKAGILDAEAGTIDLLVMKRADGIPVQAVMEIDRSVGADGVAGSADVRTLKDLPGRKVAMTRDDVGETFLAYLCSKKEVPFGQIVIVPGDPVSVADMFLKGEVDAVVTWEPNLSRALKRPGAHLLVTSKDYPRIIVDTLNVREAVIRRDPLLVRALIRGWFKSVAYYNEYPVESSTVIAPYYGMTPEEYRRAVEGLLWVDSDGQSDPERHRQLATLFDDIVEIKRANGRIRSKPRAEDAIMPAFISKERHEDRK